MPVDQNGDYIPVRDYEQDALNEVDASPAHFMEQIKGLYTAINELSAEINQQALLAQSNTTALRQSLLGGIPAAQYDTLREIADELARDDTDFASFLDALALKAPIDNAILTGTANAPTPQQASDDQTIATTSFVQALVLAMKQEIFGGTPNAQFDTITEIADELIADNQPAIEWGATSMNWGPEQMNWGADA